MQFLFWYSSTQKRINITKNNTPRFRIYSNEERYDPNQGENPNNNQNQGENQNQNGNENGNESENESVISELEELPNGEINNNAGADTNEIQSLVSKQI